MPKRSGAIFSTNTHVSHLKLDVMTKAQKIIDRAALIIIKKFFNGLPAPMPESIKYFYQRYILMLRVITVPGLKIAFLGKMSVGLNVC